MTPVQYVNKELHTPQGRRRPYDAGKKPDLQRLNQEAPIVELKRRLRPAASGTTQVPSLIVQTVRTSMETIRFFFQQSTIFARRYPLPLAAGALLGGTVLGLLIRHGRR